MPRTARLARRWHAHRHTPCGHVYQGPFKSFPVQAGGHFLTVARHVERNPLRANLVGRAEEWPWSSLGPRRVALPQSEWPTPRPPDWAERVNRPQTSAESEAIRLALSRGRPLGDAAWVRGAAEQLGLSSTLRPRGRLRKEAEAAE